MTSPAGVFLLNLIFLKYPIYHSCLYASNLLICTCHYKICFSSYVLFFNCFPTVLEMKTPPYTSCLPPLVPFTLCTMIFLWPLTPIPDAAVFCPYLSPLGTSWALGSMSTLGRVLSWTLQSCCFIFDIVASKQWNHLILAAYLNKLVTPCFALLCVTYRSIYDKGKVF